MAQSLVAVPKPSRLIIKKKFINLGLLLLGSVFYAFSFPNIITPHFGFFPLAFVAFVPVFILVERSSWVSIFIYSFIFGFLSYFIFNIWLISFHPLAIYIVPLIYACFYLVLFPLLKAAQKLFPNIGFLLQAIIWVGYEYLKTQGFLGYPYGIVGYTQFLFTPFIQVASLTGVWGVSFMVLLPSAILSRAFSSGFSWTLAYWSAFLRKNKIIIISYGILFIIVLVFGCVSQVDYSISPRVRVALIQQNSEPWKDRYSDYEAALDVLVELSEQSLASNPDMIIWSETAFVPAVYYHLRYRENREALNVVLKFQDFIKSQRIPYVIGNDDGRKVDAGGAQERRVDYNAAILFEDGEMKQVYRKTHLVPFSENLPFKNQLPWLYDMLIDAGSHFWSKGEEYTVFQAAGMSFSTPICFEDSFGYLNREFILNGADVFVNLTNDSWSMSVAAEVQHMSMALFRTIENRKSMVRSSNGGITCLIDPNGKILKQLPPFVPSYMIADVPVYQGEPTLYTLWGDWFGVLMVLVSLGFLLTGFSLALFRKMKVH
ncbi:MAG: apolipoprotein N-acyltransferase [Spirochaetales bacterium]|nr:apolipoprotein N-acyltransferase [Spirochaetales bacterium]